MEEVAIVGAGELGGAVAHALAKRDLARTITIVDESGRVAAGKALDIVQAAPVESFATALRGATDPSFASGASVVVIADRFKGGEWQGEAALALLQRLGRMASNAVIVCAGASARELVDRGVSELRMPRRRVFGSAPEALAGGARALVALALNTSPADVVLSVIGVPPAHTVIGWDDGTAGGYALTRMLDEPTRRTLDRRIAALWPPGPYALGAAAAKVVAALAGRSRRLAHCFVAPDSSAGVRTRTAALPVRLGPSGIVDVMMPSLSVAEQVALDNAMML